VKGRKKGPKRNFDHKHIAEDLGERQRVFEGGVFLTGSAKGKKETNRAKKHSVPKKNWEKRQFSHSLGEAYKLP